MFTAVVLICNLALAPTARDCDKTNAVERIVVPQDFSMPAACFVGGSAYLAETEQGRTLGPGEYVKILCMDMGRYQQKKP